MSKRVSVGNGRMSWRKSGFWTVEKKERANALIMEVWSNRKRREIRDILDHPNPPHNQRCYFGGFLRYGVGLTVDEILEICDAYARWDDYDRDITGYHLKHIGKESKAQRGIRTFYREDGLRTSSFSLPRELPNDAKRVEGIEDPAGFVMSWIKVEGKLG